MKYKIAEEPELVKIKVEMPQRQAASQKKQYCDVDVCLFLLREEGIEIESILHGHNLVVSNTEIDSRPFSGEWVFRKKNSRNSSIAPREEEVVKKAPFRSRIKKVASKPKPTTTRSRKKTTKQQ